MKRSADGFRERYGPWALVAGASEGIGAAFARALAERGLDLVLVARRAEPLRELAGQLRTQHCVQVQELPFDLARSDRLEALEAAVAGREIGLLVLNAAVSPIGPFSGVPLAQLRELLAVNCAAPLELLHHFGAQLCARGRGGAIVVSSLAGFQGTAWVAAYSASKAFGRVLAEGLWDEWRTRGVDVLACTAGATDTPGWRASRPGRSTLAPPVMAPAAVAHGALAALGRQPVWIAGLPNRLAAFALGRLLPRPWAVKLISSQTRALFAGHRK